MSRLLKNRECAVTQQFLGAAPMGSFEQVPIMGIIGNYVIWTLPLDFKHSKPIAGDIM
jgi:hypothetical protein